MLAVLFYSVHISDWKLEFLLVRVSSFMKRRQNGLKKVLLLVTILSSEFVITFFYTNYSNSFPFDMVREK